MKFDRKAMLTMTAGAAAGGLMAAPSARAADPTPGNDDVIFEGVGDGVADDGPALQAALDRLAAAGGGRLVVPHGTFRIATAVRGDFTRKAAGVRIVGSGSASRILIATGVAADAITFAGCFDLVISDLYFVGTPGQADDARCALLLTNCEKAWIRSCGFVGLAVAAATARAVIYASVCDLRISECRFGGCTASSGRNKSVVEVDQWRGIQVENTDFVDWAWLGDVYYSKTPQRSAYSWITVSRAQDHYNDGMDPNEAIFRNLRLDEGAYVPLSVRAANGPRVANVLVENVGVNGNEASGGIGMYFRNVDRLKIRASLVGLQQGGSRRNAVQLNDVVHTEIERLVARGTYDQITTVNCPTLILEDCTYGSLSTTGTTVITGTSPAMLSAAGDVTGLPPGKGLVVMSPNGQVKKRIGIDDSGAVAVTDV